MPASVAPEVRGTVLPTGRIVRNWADLKAGTCVEALDGNGQLARARIDTVNPDGTIIWLVTEGTGHRTLHLNTDPLTLYSE